MANETEYGNLNQIAAYIAANVKEYDRPFAVTNGLITFEPLQKGSKSKKFTNKGNLTAYVVAESGAATKSEYTETSVTLTLQKAVVFFEPTHEAEAYSDKDLMSELLVEAGNALTQKFEIDALGLFNGFSQSSGSTGVDLTVAAVKEAIYKAQLNDNPDDVAVVLHATQIHDLGSAIIAATGSFFTSESHDLAKAQTAQNPLVGYFLGTPVYRSNNVESINTAADWGGAAFSKKAIAAIKGASYSAMAAQDPQYSTFKMSLIMDYAVGEWDDLSGCLITSDQ